MVLSVIKKQFATVRKYIRIYIMLVKYSAQGDFVYWGNLLISILVELFYQLAFLAFFAVVITKTKTIGGWGVNEMILLLGIDTLTSEFLVGTVIVWNSRELPGKIWSGELDRILLKPIHPLFSLSLGRPYFPSFISALMGIVLITIGIIRLDTTINPSWIFGSILFFVFGFVIVYCIVIMFSLLTFFFQDSWTLPKVGERIVFSFTSRPHTIFSGVQRILFFFILPVVYVSSFTTATLISGIDFRYLGVAFVLACVFLYLLNLLWKKAIRNYSSASS